MAQPTSDEELQLKKRARRRLIGAIVLVSVVVLGLPMVLDTEPKPASQEVDIRIPSPDAGTFKSKIVPIAPVPDSKASVKAPEKAAQPESAAPKSEIPPREAPTSTGTPGVAATPAARPEPGVAEKSAAEKSAREPGADVAKSVAKGESAAEAKQGTKRAKGSHVVQVTALLNAERAKEIHEQVRAAGIKSYTEIVTTEKGEVTRVRAGPFATRDEAEKARGQLQALGLDGKVTAR